MTNETESFAREVEELRKDITMALEEIHARPSFEAPEAVKGRSRTEVAIRRVAIGWIFLGGLGVLAAVHIALASPEHDEPIRETQVGSIEVDYDVPVWVDPELGE